MNSFTPQVHIESNKDDIITTTRPPYDENNSGAGGVAFDVVTDIEPSGSGLDLHAAARSQSSQIPFGSFRMENPIATPKSNRYDTETVDKGEFEFLLNKNKTVKRDEQVPTSQSAPTQQPKEDENRGRSRSRSRNHDDNRESSRHRDPSHHREPSHERDPFADGGGLAGMNGFVSYEKDEPKVSDSYKEFFKPEPDVDFDEPKLTEKSTMSTMFKTAFFEPAAPYDKLTEEGQRRRKCDLLLEYQEKNANYQYSTKILSMDDRLEVIENELDYIRAKMSQQTSKRFFKKSLVFAAGGLVQANNLYQPFGVDMSEWHKDFTYDVQTKNDYDEYVDEIVQKYRSKLALPVEVRFAWAVGMSFVGGVIQKKQEVQHEAKIREMYLKKQREKQQEREEQAAHEMMMAQAAFERTESKRMAMQRTAQEQAAAYGNYYTSAPVPTKRPSPQRISVPVPNSRISPQHRGIRPPVAQPVAQTPTRRRKSPVSADIVLAGPSHTAEELDELLRDQFIPTDEEDDADYKFDMGEEAERQHKAQQDDDQADHDVVTQDVEGDNDTMTMNAGTIEATEGQVEFGELPKRKRGRPRKVLLPPAEVKHIQLNR